VVFVEKFQLGRIQRRAAVCERIQLELQARQLEPSFPKGKKKTDVIDDL
jgi:hypothetical protein